MYITPLLGAYLADAVMGRFWVILVFSLIYFVVSGGEGGGCTLLRGVVNAAAAASCTWRLRTSMGRLWVILVFNLIYFVVSNETAGGGGGDTLCQTEAMSWGMWGNITVNQLLNS